MKYLEKKSLKELEELRDFVSKFNSMEELLYEFDNTISTKKKDQEKSLNARFDINMFKKFNVFDPIELQVLVDNNINNLQELIDCDIDSLVGVLPSIKAKLIWVRNFYDFSSIEEEYKGKKK